MFDHFNEFGLLQDKSGTPNQRMAVGRSLVTLLRRSGQFDVLDIALQKSRPAAYCCEVEERINAGNE